jgi:hypothetical protein
MRVVELAHWRFGLNHLIPWDSLWGEDSNEGNHAAGDLVVGEIPPVTAAPLPPGG